MLLYFINFRNLI